MTSISHTERTAMAEAFERLLAEHCTEADVRRVMVLEAGYDARLWRRVAELGVTGLLISQEFGGIGAGPREVELLAEVAGAALLPSPWFASSVLAACLLTASTDDAAKSRLLPAIAGGERIATVALASQNVKAAKRDTGKVVARRSDCQWRLDGQANFVLHANAADTLLVVADTETGTASFEVNPQAAGLRITATESFDKTLRFSGLQFDAVEAVAIAGADAAAVASMLDLGRIALAGEQAGAARKVFDMTLAYIKSRVQFGRPVGGFQALKHMAADLLLEVESATSAARHAAQALDQALPETQALLNLAGFTCADTFSEVAAAAIQMHGGIGFTWDHPAHLYLRRARADAQLLGNSTDFRERYVAALEQPA